MSTEILNLEGDAVTRAEANMCVIVLVRIRTLRRCRIDPFMLHNYSASNGESLFAPYQLRLVCGAIMYKWYAKVTRKETRQTACRQSDGRIVPLKMRNPLGISIGGKSRMGK